MPGTDIRQLLPTNIVQALNNAASPTSANPFATIADITGSTVFVKRDGTTALTGNWAAGAFSITANGVVVGNAANTITGVASIKANAAAGLILLNSAGITTVTVGTGGAGTDVAFAGTITTGTWNGTAIAANFGGTGQTVYAVGDLLYASTTTALSKLADVAVGSYLRSGGVGVAPLWSTLILPNAATVNQIVYASATNTYGGSARLTFDGTSLTVDTNALGTAGFLSVSTASAELSSYAGTGITDLNAGTTNPLQIRLNKGTQTISVAAGTTSTLTLSGTTTTITATTLNLGTVSTGLWNGTAIGATFGGTGQTVYAVGDLLSANTTTTLSKIAAGATGTFLMYQGAGVLPIVSTLVLPNAITINQIPYATSANTIGSSANLIFDGTNLGIGMTPVNTLDITKNTNAGSEFDMLNNSTGAAAYTGIRLKNATNQSLYTIFGTGYTTGSYDRQDGTLLLSSGAGGLVIVSSNSNASAGIRWFFGGLLAANQMITMTSGGKTFFGGSTTPTAWVHLVAGAAGASLAPLKFTSGTNLTTAEAGAVEYDATTLWFTNGGAQRQELIQSQQSRVTTQFDKTSDTVLAAITGLTATLVAGKIYSFTAILHLTAGATGGSKFEIAGTATATAIIAEILMVDNTSNLNTISVRKTALGGTGTGQAGTTSGWISITGLITCNAAGTLVPQFSQNVSNGTASSILVGSTFVVNQIS